MNQILNAGFSFEIVKPVGEISNKGDVTKEFNVVAFSGHKPKYDIRSWLRTPEGRRAGKGITLNAEEFDVLRELIEQIPAEGLLDE